VAAVWLMPEQWPAIVLTFYLSFTESLNKSITTYLVWTQSKDNALFAWLWLWQVAGAQIPQNFEHEKFLQQWLYQ